MSSRFIVCLIAQNTLKPELKTSLTYMNKKGFLNLLVPCLVILFTVSFSFSQRRGKTKPPAKPKPIIFAVMSDGQMLEPIGVIDKGKLVGTANGGDDQNTLAPFVKNYYKPKTAYSLIFGGMKNGTVTVKSYDAKSDCGKNMAQAATASAKAKIKGMVMGLATNAAVSKSASGVRRLPTPAERAEIESLVRAEFTKQGVSSNAVKNLKYHNLTALDIDNDGKAELVGSFWVENSANEKNLLFFIADKGANGKYNFGHSEYSKVSPEDVMSGELKDLDEGIGHELLLDIFEYNGDTSAEIFTVSRAFEGNNFTVYSRKNGKWTKVFEGYNYHCAY